MPLRRTHKERFRTSGRMRRARSIIGTLIAILGGALFLLGFWSLNMWWFFEGAAATVIGGLIRGL